MKQYKQRWGGVPVVCVDFVHTIGIIGKSTQHYGIDNCFLSDWQHPCFFYNKVICCILTLVNIYVVDEIVTGHCVNEDNALNPVFIWFGSIILT